MVAMFTPFPLYVFGIVYAIRHRVCCKCCCPNAEEKAAKEAKKLERRETRAKLRQEHEDKKQQKKNKKQGSSAADEDSNEHPDEGAENLPLSPVATSETFVSGDSDSSNNGTSLASRDADEKRRTQANGPNSKTESLLKADA